MFSLEIVRTPRPQKPLKAAVFDYDGTISLIVEGWQRIFFDLFVETLSPLPGGDRIPASYLRDIIDFNTGKQTIVQTRSLAEEVEKLGGVPRSPQEYLDEFNIRLDRLIVPRVREIRNGRREKHLVPGIVECLAMLRRHGLTMFVVSGSETQTVREGIEQFGLVDYFQGGVFGSKRGDHRFSKEEIIVRFLEERSLDGRELIGFGDGFVETNIVHKLGGFAVGIAFDETARQGIDPARRLRLIESGADWIIPHFQDVSRLETELFHGGL